MRTKRLWIGSLSITLILSLMCSLLLLFPSQRVQAETSIEDKCAQYTSTDLLKNTSSGKDIFDFASELNIAAYGAPDSGFTECNSDRVSEAKWRACCI